MQPIAFLLAAVFALGLPQHPHKPAPKRITQKEKYELLLRQGVTLDPTTPVHTYDVRRPTDAQGGLYVDASQWVDFLENDASLGAGGDVMVSFKPLVPGKLHLFLFTIDADTAGTAHVVATGYPSMNVQIHKGTNHIPLIVTLLEPAGSKNSAADPLWVTFSIPDVNWTFGRVLVQQLR